MVSVFEPDAITLTAILPSVVLLNGAAPIRGMAFEKNFEQWKKNFDGAVQLRPSSMYEYDYSGACIIKLFTAVIYAF